MRVRGSLEVRASDRGSSLIVMCVVWYGNWVYIQGIRGEDPPSRLSPKIRISLNSSKALQTTSSRAPGAAGAGPRRGAGPLLSLSFLRMSIVVKIYKSTLYTRNMHGFLGTVVVVYFV